VVNLKGGPAMDLRQYMTWKQKTIIGLSVTATAPTRQYDPALRVNLGTVRWAIKPELGLSHRYKNWVLDLYSGVWFFSENLEYYSHSAMFPGVNTQSQGRSAQWKGTSATI